MNNITKGHSLIFGGNGSGKTVLQNFLNCQFSRYHGQTIIFDRDQSAEIYVRAMGGHYFYLTPSQYHSIKLNPLQLPDSPDNRAFLQRFLIQLAKNNDDDQLSAAEEMTLLNCVEGCFNLPKEERRLSNIIQFMPINFARLNAIKRFVKADEQSIAGQFAYLFDHESDNLDFKSIVGIDITHLLDNEPSYVLAAMMMYLYYVIEQQLTGDKPFMVINEEGWQCLDNAYFKEKLKRWFPTLRKKNCFLVLTTQSPQSILQSEICHQILDNIATLIIFPNDEANAEQYIEGLGLNSGEFDFVKHTPLSKRLFLVKQSKDAAICQLQLKSLPKHLSVLAGNQHTTKILNRICKEVGYNPNDFLPLFYQEVFQS